MPEGPGTNLVAKLQEPVGGGDDARRPGDVDIGAHLVTPGGGIDRDRDGAQARKGEKAVNIFRGVAQLDDHPFAEPLSARTQSARQALGDLKRFCVAYGCCAAVEEGGIRSRVGGGAQ